MLEFIVSNLLAISILSLVLVLILGMLFLKLDMKKIGPIFAPIVIILTLIAAILLIQKSFLDSLLFKILIVLIFLYFMYSLFIRYGKNI